MELREAFAIVAAAVAGVLLFALTLVAAIAIERATERDPES